MFWNRDDDFEERFGPGRPDGLLRLVFEFATLGAYDQAQAPSGPGPEPATPAPPKGESRTARPCPAARPRPARADVVVAPTSDECTSPAHLRSCAHAGATSTLRQRALARRHRRPEATPAPQPCTWIA